MASLLQASSLVLFLLLISNGFAEIAEDRELQDLLDELQADSITKREETSVEFPPQIMTDNVDHMKEEQKLSGLGDIQDTMTTDDDDKQTNVEFPPQFMIDKVDHMKEEQKLSGLGDIQDTMTTDDEAKPIDTLYEQVGCFSDKGGSKRPLPVLLKNLRPHIDWHNLNRTIRACAHLAKAKGFRYFGIQFYGECWSGPTGDRTFDKDGSSDRCEAGVGKTWANFVYRFKEDECSNYSELDSPDRSENNGDSGVYTCDKTLTQGWYRFTGQAGTHMATKCVPKYHCGAHAPGWMTGTLPSVVKGIVTRKVCFNWRNDCCNWSSDILVKNCGGFFVYRLQKPSICRLRYCGSSNYPNKRTIISDIPESTTNGLQEPGKEPLPHVGTEMDTFMGNDDVLEYEQVGCYGDRGGDHRPLPVLLKNLRPQIDWKDLNKTVRACASLAQAKGYQYFGIQFYGECWSGPTADQTYNSQGSSKECVMGVGKAGANFVYRFVEEEKTTTAPITTVSPSPDGCSNYIELNSADRSEKHPPGGDYMCDKNFTQASWYRFTGQAGTHMATKCVPKFHCGTHSPGWMTGTLPSVSEGTVNRKVCFNWRDDCCNWESKVQVKNCGGFYVYSLPAPPNCRLRYCGSNKVLPTAEPPTTAESTTTKLTTTARPTTTKPTTARPTTTKPTTTKPTTTKPTTARPTTTKPTTARPTTTKPTTARPTTTEESTTKPSAGECTNYDQLDSADRSENHGPNSVFKCDKTLTQGWYRFSGEAGTHMATKCATILHCGTHAPGWMSGTLPSVAEGVVTRTVCFNWLSDCCRYNTSVSLRNCGGFFVYNLPKPPLCTSRYCGSSQALPTVTVATKRPTTTERTTKSRPATIKPTTMRPMPIKTFRLCEDMSGILRCPPGQKIKIRYANYGRTQGRSVCPHPSIRTTKCYSYVAANLVRCACNGHNSCPLYAKSQVYGDPCLDTFKYIEVKYQCIS